MYILVNEFLHCFDLLVSTAFGRLRLLFA